MLPESSGARLMRPDAWARRASILDGILALFLQQAQGKVAPAERG